MIELFWAFFFLNLYQQTERYLSYQQESEPSLGCNCKATPLLMLQEKERGLFWLQGFMYLIWQHKLKNPKFFMNFKEYRQALYVTIIQHDSLMRMRRSLGLSRTHVHPEEESTNRKLQACAPSETQDMGKGKGWFFGAFWHQTNYLSFSNHHLLKSSKIFTVLSSTLDSLASSL